MVLISKDGGSPQAVTPEEVRETDSTWLPDGITLAFGHRGLTAEDAFIELFNLKTRQLSHLLGGDKIFAPRRSPDGRFIIAISAGNNKLMLYDVKAEKWRQLNTTPDFFGYLAWSQDSAYVYFDTVLKAITGIFACESADSKFEKVADLKKVRKFRGQFGPGSWTGLAPAPGEIPLVPRDISTQEIYTFDLQLP